MQIRETTFVRMTIVHDLNLLRSMGRGGAVCVLKQPHHIAGVSNSPLSRH